MNNKKILYIAYGCEPFVGSEQGVGWNWANGLAKIAQVTVITRANNKTVIDKWLKLNDSTLDFIYYDLDDWLKQFKKEDKGVYLYYYMWRYGVHKLCKKMDLSQYDLIWDTNFGNVFLPTYSYKYDIKSVAGPVGYGLGVTHSFAKRYSYKQQAKHTIKRILFKKPKNVELFARMVFKSDKIICSAPWLYNAMNENVMKKSMLVLYNGISVNEIDSIVSNEILVNKEKFNILCIGRMVNIKEFELAIKAIEKVVMYDDICLHIIGWGEEENKLKSLVSDNNMSNNVLFYGKQSRQKVIAFLKQSDMLIMPSVSEGLSTMAMEAMACRCLPLLMDIPAHTLLANENCSIKVKGESPQVAVKEFAEAIEKCYKDRILLNELSNNARVRAENYFDWSCRTKDYQKVLDFCMEDER